MRSKSNTLSRQHKMLSEWRPYEKVITILLIILVLAAGVGFGVYHHKSNETKFNDDYINGNTAGNLYNAGIFCTAADGTIYFANPSDSSNYTQ